MFVVSEADAAAIRTAFEQRGELSAAVELRRRFPGIVDNVQARECARIIVGWKPLLKRPLRRKKAPLRLTLDVGQPSFPDPLGAGGADVWSAGAALTSDE